MRALLTISWFVACLLCATTARAQNASGQPPTASAPPVAMADCHPSSFGKLVDVTTADGRMLRASIRCLDPQNVQLLRDGAVTSTPLTDVRRIVTRPDPIWDGFVKGAAIPLIVTAIFCFDCLDDTFTYRGALAYGLVGVTWDALQPNRRTIFDSGGRSSGVTASVSIPLGRLVGLTGPRLGR